MQQGIFCQCSQDLSEFVPVELWLSQRHTHYAVFSVEQQADLSPSHRNKEVDLWAS